MEVDREDGRTQNQLRPLACSRNVLHRAHGSASWYQGISFGKYFCWEIIISIINLFLFFFLCYFCLGDTKVLAAVYGPKAGARKNENPEKACIEVIWKPKTGQTGNFFKPLSIILAFDVWHVGNFSKCLPWCLGKLEKEYEMILKRTLQSICILTVNPNTTTSIIIQVSYLMCSL